MDNDNHKIIMTKKDLIHLFLDFSNMYCFSTIEENEVRRYVDFCIESIEKIQQKERG